MQRNAESKHEPEEDLSLKVITTLHQDLTESKEYASMGQPSPAVKELAPEIQNMIHAARHDYKVKSQKAFTKKMQKKLARFNTKLREQLKDNTVSNSTKPPHALRNVEEVKELTQTSFGPMGSVTGAAAEDHEHHSIQLDKEAASPIRESYWDIKNRTLQSLNDSRSNISVGHADDSSTT